MDLDSTPAPQSRASNHSPLEMKRKLAHLLPGGIPFVMWLIPHDDPLPWWNLLIVAGVVAALILIALRHDRSIRRDEREHGLRTCLTYALPPLLMLILFPGNAEWAAAVLATLAFGDAPAGLAGRVWGRRTLPWNPQKTWVGTLCFVVCAVPMASLAFWGEAHPAVPFRFAVFSSLIAVPVAALLESIPSRIDDNLRVSVSAGVCMVLVSGALT